MKGVQRKFLVLLLVLLVGQCRIFAAAQSGTNACIVRLRNLYLAIQHYREFHNETRKELPSKLADLNDDHHHLSDATTLRCPAGDSYDKAKWRPDEIFDRTTTYLYEFGTNPMPKVIPGANRTMREWKRMQMGYVGGGVPIVRCLAHQGHALNLGFDGSIYLSERDWERNFTNVVSWDPLLPVHLMSRGEPVRVVLAPQRAPGTPARFLDLSRFYNASLTEAWEPGRLRPHLTNLVTGLQRFDGVEFDTRGIVQLRGERFVSSVFPRMVNDLPIQQLCKRLHFLHGSAFASSRTGRSIGTYVIHYDGGQTNTTPIRYGRDVVDLCEEPGNAEAARAQAWRGQYQSSTGEVRPVFLYHKVWENPLPGTFIRSLDFVSEMEDPAPFLIAITAEQ